MFLSKRMARTPREKAVLREDSNGVDDQDDNCDALVS